MPVLASHPDYPGFNPYGHRANQARMEWVDRNVPTEVQHFAVTSVINLVARNPYVFVGTLVAHGGYHLYESLSGMVRSGSIVGGEKDVYHNAVLPGTKQSLDMIAVPIIGSGSVVGKPRQNQLRKSRGSRRCPRRRRGTGVQCLLRRGHSGSHRYKSA